MSAEEFALPRNLGAANVPRLFQMCRFVQERGEAGAILDASGLEFVDPLGIAVLGALLEGNPGFRVSAPWMTTSTASYLDRMGLFQRCELGSVHVPTYSRHDKRTSLVELTCITDERHVDDASDRLADAVAGFLGEGDASAQAITDRGVYEYIHPLRYSLRELLTNALTHARRAGCGHASVWVAAQYYQSRGAVRIAVVDNGCGMLATLKDHPEVAEQSHPKAIAAALKPKVSCNRNYGGFLESGNEGIGLTTSAAIVRRAGGHMMIVSGDGYHGGAREFALPNGFWSGVAISFTMRRDQLHQVRVEDALPRQELPAPAIRFE